MGLEQEIPRLKIFFKRIASVMPGIVNTTFAVKRSGNFPSPQNTPFGPQRYYGLHIYPRTFNCL